MIFEELVRHKWTVKHKFPKAGDFFCLGSTVCRPKKAGTSLFLEVA